jgi:hypothetical protein
MLISSIILRLKPVNPQLGAIGAHLRRIHRIEIDAFGGILCAINALLSHPERDAASKVYVVTRSVS